MDIEMPLQIVFYAEHSTRAIQVSLHPHITKQDRAGDYQKISGTARPVYCPQLILLTSPMQGKYDAQ